MRGHLLAIEFSRDTQSRAVSVASLARLIFVHGAFVRSDSRLDDWFGMADLIRSDHRGKHPGAALAQATTAT